MTSAQRRPQAPRKAHGFDIWAQHSPDANPSTPGALHLAAIAVDLPPSTRRRGVRLVLVQGALTGTFGRTRFVAARLLRQADYDELGNQNSSETYLKEATQMTDKELSEFGGKLYEAVLFTPLPAATVFSLALAVRQAIPWAHLPQHLKFAVFKIAASCTGEVVVDTSAPPASQAASEPRDTADGDAHAAVGPATNIEAHASEGHVDVLSPAVPAGDGEASAA